MYFYVSWPASRRIQAEASAMRMKLNIKLPQQNNSAQHKKAIRDRV
jgi:hypothetical protein